MKMVQNWQQVVFSYQFLGGNKIKPYAYENELQKLDETHLSQSFFYCMTHSKNEKVLY